MKIAVLGLVFMLSGCISGAPDLARYPLSPTLPEATTSHKWGSLLVEKPTAEVGLDSDRIQVQQANGQITVIENAGWVAPLDTMLQNILVQSLDQSGSFKTIVKDADSRKTSLILRTTIQRFTLVYAPTPHIEVSLRVALINAANGNQLKSQTITASAPVETIRMHTVIPAFNTALSDCLNQLQTLLQKHP